MDAEKRVHVHIIIPQHTTSLLLGKHGSNVKRLAHRSQVYLTIRPVEDSPHSEDRVLVITGFLRNVQSAIRDVIADIQDGTRCNDEVPPTQYNKGKVTLQIPSAFASDLMRQGVKALKELQQASGARFQVSHVEDMTLGSIMQHIDVTGTEENVRRATGHVLARLHDFSERFRQRRQDDDMTLKMMIPLDAMDHFSSSMLRDIRLGQSVMIKQFPVEQMKECIVTLSGTLNNIFKAQVEIMRVLDSHNVLMVYTHPNVKSRATAQQHSHSSQPARRVEYERHALRSHDQYSDDGKEEVDDFGRTRIRPASTSSQDVDRRRYREVRASPDDHRDNGDYRDSKRAKYDDDYARPATNQNEMPSRPRSRDGRDDRDDSDTALPPPPMYQTKKSWDLPRTDSDSTATAAMGNSTPRIVSLRGIAQSKATDPRRRVQTAPGGSNDENPNIRALSSGGSSDRPTPQPSPTHEAPKAATVEDKSAPAKPIDLPKQTDDTSATSQPKAPRASRFLSKPTESDTAGPPERQLPTAPPKATAPPEPTDVVRVADNPLAKLENLLAQKQTGALGRQTSFESTSTTAKTIPAKAKPMEQKPLPPPKEQDSNDARFRTQPPEPVDTSRRNYPASSAQQPSSSHGSKQPTPPPQPPSRGLLPNPSIEPSNGHKQPSLLPTPHSGSGIDAHTGRPASGVFNAPDQRRHSSVDSSEDSRRSFDSRRRQSSHGDRGGREDGYNRKEAVDATRTYSSSSHAVSEHPTLPGYPRPPRAYESSNKGDGAADHGGFRRRDSGDVMTKRVFVHIIIPSETTSLLLGKQGSNIKRIAKLSECYLTIRPPDDAPHAEDNVLVVNGSLAHIHNAIREVIADIQRGTRCNEEVAPKPYKDGMIEMQVPSAFATHVMHDGGKVLQELAQDTGARFQLTPVEDMALGSTMRQMYVMGSEESARTAAKRVVLALHEFHARPAADREDEMTIKMMIPLDVMVHLRPATLQDITLSRAVAIKQFPIEEMKECLVTMSGTIGDIFKAQTDVMRILDKENIVMSYVHPKARSRHGSSSGGGGPRDKSHPYEQDRRDDDRPSDHGRRNSSHDDRRYESDQRGSKQDYRYDTTHSGKHHREYNREYEQKAPDDHGKQYRDEHDHRYPTNDEDYYKRSRDSGAPQQWNNYETSDHRESKRQKWNNNYDGETQPSSTARPYDSYQQQSQPSRVGSYPETRRSSERPTSSSWRGGHH
ncbi:Aste57867_17940 [Aphanomyces stellatus]|uniref:Aste57867_17940 protein n=1 Tax=Aphanomyces stellatus TaxID=120398 RepID=A0A485LAJ3_9STRA|nr:hypothetical protein As57867_017878 [Aphanomyces stellatus]VFT94681.1 Aste57867_17940 [Aphanomyces stellatus]